MEPRDRDVNTREPEYYPERREMAPPQGEEELAAREKQTHRHWGLTRPEPRRVYGIPQGQTVCPWCGGFVFEHRRPEVPPEEVYEDDIESRRRSLGDWAVERPRGGGPSGQYPRGEYRGYQEQAPPSREPQYRQQYREEGAYHRYEEPYREGPYRGRGPAAIRTDEDLRMAVERALTEDSWLDATDVRATAQDGVVTLEGQVNSRDDKRWAEMLVDRIAGVKDVRNNLTIRESQQTM